MTVYPNCLLNHTRIIYDKYIIEIFQGDMILFLDDLLKITNIFIQFLWLDNLDLIFILLIILITIVLFSSTTWALDNLPLTERKLISKISYNKLGLVK